MPQDAYRSAFSKTLQSIKRSLPILLGVLMLLALLVSLVPRSLYGKVFTGSRLIDPLIGAAIGSVSGGNHGGNQRWNGVGKRLMAIFAHPDDEGQIAGLMAMYASREAEVSLVSATRGELGSTTDPSFLEGRTMGELREEELRYVSKVLVRNLEFLDYQEGLFHTADSDE